MRSCFEGPADFEIHVLLDHIKAFVNEARSCRSVDGYLTVLGTLVSRIEALFRDRSAEVFEKVLNCEEVITAIAPLADYLPQVKFLMMRDPRHAKLRTYLDALVSYLQRSPVRVRRELELKRPSLHDLERGIEGVPVVRPPGLEEVSKREIESRGEEPKEVSIPITVEPKARRSTATRRAGLLAAILISLAVAGFLAHVYLPSWGPQLYGPVTYTIWSTYTYTMPITVYRTHMVWASPATVTVTRFLTTTATLPYGATLVVSPMIKWVSPWDPSPYDDRVHAVCTYGGYVYAVGTVLKRGFSDYDSVTWIRALSKTDGSMVLEEKFDFSNNPDYPLTCTVHGGALLLGTLGGSWRASVSPWRADVLKVCPGYDEIDLRPAATIGLVVREGYVYALVAGLGRYDEPTYGALKVVKLRIETLGGEYRVVAIKSVTLSGIYAGWTFSNDTSYRLPPLDFQAVARIRLGPDGLIWVSGVLVQPRKGAELCATVLVALDGELNEVRRVTLPHDAPGLSELMCRVHDFTFDEEGNIYLVGGIAGGHVAKLTKNFNALASGRYTSQASWTTVSYVGGYVVIVAEVHVDGWRGIALYVLDKGLRVVYEGLLTPRGVNELLPLATLAVDGYTIYVPAIRVLRSLAEGWDTAWVVYAVELLRPK